MPRKSKKTVRSGRDYYQSFQNFLGNEPNGLDTLAKRKAYKKAKKGGKK